MSAFSRLKNIRLNGVVIKRKKYIINQQNTLVFCEHGEGDKSNGLYIY